MTYDTTQGVVPGRSIDRQFCSFIECLGIVVCINAYMAPFFGIMVNNKEHNK